MKKSVMSLFALSTLLMVTPVFAQKALNLDPAQSTIKWSAKKVTGAHYGKVVVKSGQVETDGKSIKGGQFEINMNSILVEDIADPKSNKQLTDHLRSDDFFSVEKHPLATFKITSVKPVSGKADATHEIEGDLTIKGITNKEKFPALVTLAANGASAKGKVSIDRTKYDIRFRSGKFFSNLGDKMIYDNFDLELDLKTK